MTARSRSRSRSRRRSPSPRAPESAFNDLEAALEERDPEAVGTIESALTDLDRISREANEGGAVASQEEIEAVHDTASDTFDAILPEEWKESDTEADFDLIDDHPRPDGGGGQRRRARAGRAGAPHRLRVLRVRPRAPAARPRPPGRRPRSRGWSGTGPRGEEGLAELIASDGSIRDLRDTRLALDEALEHARADHGRGRQRRHGDHERRADRVPRGPRGDPDHRRDHGEHGRGEPWAAPPDPARGAARPAGQRPAVRRLGARARLALPVRREARGDRGPGGDRGAVAGPELVLPPRLLDGLDRRASKARARRSPARPARRRGGRDHPRPLPARLLERLPGGLRDRAVPPGAPARGRDRHRPRRCVARAGR